MVFTERAVSARPATYYGSFGANLVAANWVMINEATDAGQRRNKRLLLFGAGAVYSALVLTAVFTMRMVLGRRTDEVFARAMEIGIAWRKSKRYRENGQCRLSSQEIIRTFISPIAGCQH